MEALLDSGATGLVMSSEFARKRGLIKKLGEANAGKERRWVVQ